MLLVYENRDKGISVEWKRVVHMPPHLHEAIEIVYVTNGNIALDRYSFVSIFIY